MKIRATNIQQGVLDKALNDLTDIQLSSPSNGQVLKYNSTSGKWENGTDVSGGAGGLSFGDFSVETDPASGGGDLTYTSGVFTYTPAETYSLPTASDTVLGGVKVDGTSITITDGVISSTATGGATSLADLSDVNITGSITAGYVLKWNGSAWAPGVDATTGGGGTDADTLDGQHGSYYLNYANFSGSPSLSVTTNSASGNGSLSYNAGTFTFTPADVPTDISELSDNTNLLFDGQYSSLSGAPSAYSLPTASGSTLGGVKVGTGLSIDGSGVLSVSYTSNQNLGTTNNVTFANITSTGILVTNEVVEGFQTYNTTITGSPVIAFSATSGHIVNVTGTISSNFTANWTNTSLTAGQASNFTVILNQGATAYVVSALQIGGAGQTINWQGNAVPSGNANKKDVFAFTVMCTASNTYTVFGQLVSFG